MGVEEGSKTWEACRGLNEWMQLAQPKNRTEGINFLFSFFKICGAGRKRSRYLNGDTYRPCQ